MSQDAVFRAPRRPEPEPSRGEPVFSAPRRPPPEPSHGELVFSAPGRPQPEPSHGELGALIRSTTVLCVRHEGKVVLGADGQVSMGNTIVKGTARKVRTLAKGKILAGFAGSAADGLTLCDLLEAKLDAVGGNFTRACVELAKDWRLDRRYRRLEALLIVADKDRSLLLSGTGDVIEAEDGILAIGSGGNYALSAARALMRYSELDARGLVEAGLGIAGEICVFTNNKTTILELAQEEQR